MADYYQASLIYYREHYKLIFFYFILKFKIQEIKSLFHDFILCKNKNERQ